MASRTSSKMSSGSSQSADSAIAATMGNLDAPCAPRSSRATSTNDASPASRNSAKSRIAMPSCWTLAASAMRSERTSQPLPGSDPDARSPDRDDCRFGRRQRDVAAHAHPRRRQVLRGNGAGDLALSSIVDRHRSHMLTFVRKPIRLTSTGTPLNRATLLRVPRR